VEDHAIQTEAWEFGLHGRVEPIHQHPDVKVLLDAVVLTTEKGKAGFIPHTVHVRAALG
jgi:hypothetical protein